MTNEISLVPPTINCDYLAEPLLAFDHDGLHVDPREGLARFGPRSLSSGRHPRVIGVGVIGTAETIELAHKWLEQMERGIPGDKTNPEFPGFARDRGFYADLVRDDGWNQQITQSELEAVTDVSSQRDRFEAGLELLDEKVAALAESDRRSPDYVLIAMPHSLYGRCRVADYRDRELGQVHRDLRRALKARAMRHRLPTQLLRQTVAEGKDKDHPAKIAWNFATALYYKSGGLPWAPTGLAEATCYIGVSFYRALGTARPTIRASVAQAFDEYGDGLVLRGQEFEWDTEAERTSSPHLSEDGARSLVTLALDRYQRETQRTPTRVVVHKSSRFWPEEREGFRSALRARTSRYDLLSLYPQREVRLFAESKYPPLRGARFRVGDLDYLYTTGFIAELGQFHALHVPSPLAIADHIGQDTTRDELLREVMTLTKLNWNSARLGGLLPVTLRFSTLFGDILKEVPTSIDPLPQFKFYI